MQDIILVGSGGCMREIAWQMLEMSNNKNTAWNIVGYVDCKKPETGNVVTVGGRKIPYLGDDEFILKETESVNVAICVGTPSLRKKIAKKLEQNPNIRYPNVLLGNTKICSDARMGKGCIICADTGISTNTVLGDFVFMNIGALVCHDGYLADFVTLGPDAKLAGNVNIGAESDIGIGTKIIQGITIGSRVIVGAGSVIIRDVKEDCTVAGVPAGRIK